MFFPHADEADYLSLSSRLPLAYPSLNFFSISALDAGIGLRGYRAVLWVLGNSHHHVNIAKTLRSVRDLPNPVPYWIEIHDPVVFNLVSRVAALEGCEFLPFLRRGTSIDLSELDRDRLRAGDHAELIERGVIGVRALLADLPLAGLVVHSHAARDLIMRDWPDFDPSRIHVLYHPVFEPLQPEKPAPAVPRLRLGSFGVPGGHKQTEKVVETFRLIRAEHPAATLLLAGYDVANYAASRRLGDEPGLALLDSPPCERLLESMREVDVAVQLRDKNTGESSGVVPQLLASNTMIIASDIGALSDYGDAVRHVPNDIPAAALAAAILDEAAAPGRRADARAAHVRAHTPHSFCEALLDALGEPAPDSGPAAHDPARHGAADTGEPHPRLWPEFERLLDETGARDDPYVQTHLLRYRHTLAAIEAIGPAAGGSALEVGTSWLFALLLRAKLGFERVDVTDFRPGDERRTIQVDLCYPTFTGPFQAFNVNLEADPLPAADAQYDLALCCEVIEHMDVDPMFLLAELNRTLRVGGKLLITTPNVTSSRNVAKILRGYAPHFFMQYHKDRSPYRHNIEYAPDQLAALVEAAGFTIDRLWTADTFEPAEPKALDILARLRLPTGNRGDNMFVVATKAGALRDRHPPAAYV
jgi:SAM-dependent methyltransferase